CASRAAELPGNPSSLQHASRTRLGPTSRHLVRVVPCAPCAAELPGYRSSLKHASRTRFEPTSRHLVRVVRARRGKAITRCAHSRRRDQKNGLPVEAARRRRGLRQGETHTTLRLSRSSRG